MNNGIFGEGFPYSNFHDLNMDWIIKIAKDFLDQYSHIQEIIENGETTISEAIENGTIQIGEFTAEKLADLQDKATELEGLLDQWYNTHSADIARELARAINSFDTHADTKGAEVIESIPEDYSKLSSDVSNLKNINGLSYTEGGYIEATNGTVHTPAPERYYTDFIPCKENATVKYIAESNHENIFGIAFYDINFDLILGYSNNGTIGEEITVTSPANTAYCRSSTRLSILEDSYVHVSNGSLADTIAKVLHTIPNVNNYDNEFGLKYTEGGYIEATRGTIRTPAPERYYTDFIPCKENATVKYIAESNHENIFGIAFYDINFDLILGYSNNGTIGEEITVTSPANTAYCRSSTRLSILENSHVHVENGSVANTIGKLRDRICFVSPNGSDTDNDGTMSKPYATVNKALEEYASKIMVIGGRYFQTIDLSLAKHPKITITSRTPTERAIFLHPDSFVTDTEAKTTGYTKIYQAPYSGSIRAGIRLFQENVPDQDTRILDAEQSPYQRGQAYRCLDTKIIQCTATTKNEALAEIESSTEYKYFHDTTNEIIYFSRPHAVTSGFPIMRSVHIVTFFEGQFRGTELEMNGIETRYMRLNVTNMVATLTDCKSSYTFGTGGFMYDWAFVKFIRCEACGTYYAGSGGDGFNAHSLSSGGDIFSKETTGLLIDCWAHDCMDDGYSDHERCETEVYGGLFEYNGKAGITPSYGTHCSCYNVISRRNQNGFWYLGEVTQEEGGKGGQMLCISCVAEENHDSGNGCGFCVSSTGNLAELINCKSINNDIGYSNGTNTIMKIVDCGSTGDTTTKQIGGTLIVNNTTAVS